MPCRFPGVTPKGGFRGIYPGGSQAHHPRGKSFKSFDYIQYSPFDVCGPCVIISVGLSGLSVCLCYAITFLVALLRWPRYGFILKVYRYILTIFRST